MADKKGGGGFGWFVVGGLLGFLAGAYVASGPGRDHVELLKTKTVELTGGEPVQKAKDAARKIVSDPEHPVGRAIQEGIAAAKRKRGELEDAAARVEVVAKSDSKNANGPASS